MRAIEVSRFGGPEVLELRALPDPAPGPGQVLVATAASDVLFVDTMIRSGRGADYFPIRPPYIPGNGVGGTITAVGEGVEGGRVGETVVAHTGGAGGQGGYSELAVADLEACAGIPDGVELLDATAVLHDGTTALRVMEVTGVRSRGVGARARRGGRDGNPSRPAAGESRRARRRRGAGTDEAGGGLWRRRRCRGRLCDTRTGQTKCSQQRVVTGPRSSLTASGAPWAARRSS